MTSIEERLTRIEAHLFGKAEQAKTKERTFEAFYVDCTREEYPEVKAILQSQGYRLMGTEWLERENCVSTLRSGRYLTFVSSNKRQGKPTLTLAQLREKFGVKPTEEVKKPPLGIKPLWLLQEQRKNELEAAIHRYIDAGAKVPQEWLFEHDELKRAIDLRAQRNDKPTEQPTELRDLVVPLEHATLTRDEVAVRCVAAAEKKGYRADEDVLLGKLHDDRTHVAFYSDETYMFHNHECDVEDHTTLEAFEEYCGVQQPQQYVGLADEKAEPQVHGIVNTLDAPQKSKTRLEWLNELPDGYRERAVANCTEWSGNSPQDVCDSMEDAIVGMCDWSDTPERCEFWTAVHSYYEDGTPLPPLTSGNSEKPNNQEPTEQPIYDAGFWFSGQLQCLSLSDCTTLWLNRKTQIWCKNKWLSHNEPTPHTLTPVSHHTVGKFYALAGIEPNHLNDWRSYALCVKNEDVPHFVRPTSEYGIVSIDRIRPSHVSLNEVTPV